MPESVQFRLGVAFNFVFNKTFFRFSTLAIATFSGGRHGDHSFVRGLTVTDAGRAYPRSDLACSSVFTPVIQLVTVPASLFRPGVSPRVAASRTTRLNPNFRTGKRADDRSLTAAVTR